MKAAVQPIYGMVINVHFVVVNPNNFLRNNNVESPRKQMVRFWVSEYVFMRAVPKLVDSSVCVTNAPGVYLIVEVVERDTILCE